MQIHYQDPVRSNKAIALRNGWESYLAQQLQLGLKPRFLVSWHYRSADEALPRSVTGSLFKKVGAEQTYQRKRGSLTEVRKDCHAIKNRLLKTCYGIKRINQVWKHPHPPMLFVHETGRGSQLHTHALLPEPITPYNSEAALTQLLNGEFRQKVRSLSKDRTIDVREVYDAEGVISYLLKETSPEKMAIDLQQSVFLTPLSCGGVATRSQVVPSQGGALQRCALC